MGACHNKGSATGKVTYITKGRNVEKNTEPAMPAYKDTETITKQYGARIAFTNDFKDNVKLLKQDAKDGNLQMESWFAKDISDTAYYYGYDDNLSVQRFAQDVNGIIKTAKTGNRTQVQAEIDKVQKDRYNQYSPRYQRGFNRGLYK